MKKLTLEEREHLEDLLRRSKDVLERNRLCVILGYDEGITKISLAKTLRISPHTVDAYLREYKSKNKTSNKPRGGSDSKLCDEQKLTLLRHLQETTYLKVQAICAYVTKAFGIHYTRTGMRDWLIREGFVYKRPQKVPAKLDLEKQRAFITHYRALKDSLKADEEIYFVDAAHPEYQSQSICGWIRKGEKKTLQTTAKQTRMHIAGALSLDGMKIFTQEYKTINELAMLDFFLKLQEQSKSRVIHVILDNATAHKNQLIRTAFAHSKIKFHYLPSYSPNLNPIERLWKLMRECVHYNRYYDSFTQFCSHTREFLHNTIPNMTQVLKQRINDQFQIIKLNPINLGV